jgi:hypothetical protein
MDEEYPEVIGKNGDGFRSIKTLLPHLLLI